MRRIVSIVAAVSLLMLLCGCQTLTADTGSLLRPPSSGSEQAAIQAALASYISRTAGTEDYVLKYPKTGAYLSSFVMQDMDADGVEEAVCFYRLNRANEKVHVHLLKKQSDGWTSISDVTGEGAEVEWVAFGDLQGDGCPELLTGWNVYSNNRDRDLVLYTLESDSLTERYRATCSAVAIGDITATGRDTLMLFTIDSTVHTVTADLIGMVEDSVTQFDSTALDGGITRFGTAQVCSFADGVNGVMVDAYKDNNQAITELIYWEGRRLWTPFYDVAQNLTEVTARETPADSLIVSTDVNGDGIPEWPRTRRLVGYEEVELNKALLLTTWMKWNYTTKTVEPLFDCVVNETDGYYLRLDPSWIGGTRAEDRVSARYTAATHTFELLCVQDGTVGEPLLAIVPTALPHDEMFETMQSFKLTLEDNNAYTVFYTEEEIYRFTEERIRYLVTVMGG